MRRTETIGIGVEMPLKKEDVIGLSVTIGAFIPSEVLEP